MNFPGQSLSKTLEEAMDLSQDRLILELEYIIIISSKPIIDYIFIKYNCYSVTFLCRKFTKNNHS
jgi:hypothetical protein